MCSSVGLRRPFFFYRSLSLAYPGGIAFYGTGSSALSASAASFHRLLFDRQASRLAFTFFHHCLLRWFISVVCSTLSRQLAIKHAAAASASHDASDVVGPILTGIAKARKEFPSRYIRRAWTRSSKNSS